MTALVLEGVAVERGGRRVLDGVDAVFGPGLTAVIGPNGAGKSSLLAVAAGLLRPAAGRVSLDGAALASIPRRELARRRAYLPQGARVEWPLPVERVVALGLTPALPAFGDLPSALSGAVDLALATYGLEPLRGRPATGLSGGELARVMLARATVGRPSVLLVDEPTAGLDPRHALEAMFRLKALAEEGRTVAAAIHDLALAVRFADRAVALKDGRVAAAGPAGAVFTDAGLSDLYDLETQVTGAGPGASVRFIG